MNHVRDFSGGTNIVDSSLRNIVDSNIVDSSSRLTNPRDLRRLCLDFK